MDRTAYFDNAATTYPKPTCVYDFMDKFYRAEGASAGRGKHRLTSESSRLISGTRVLVKELLCCPNKDVVFTPSATAALNMILQGTVRRLEAKGGTTTAYISPFEHNAVTRVLHAIEEDGRCGVKVLPIRDGLVYDMEELRRVFEAEPPSLLAVSHVSNMCGLVQPVEALCRLAKEYAAVTVLDMAQSAVLVPLETGSDLFDFAVFAGHKTIMGPFGASGFVKSPTTPLPPVIFGGTGTESARQDMPDEAPARYEPGSMNTHAIAGLNAALTWWKADADAIRRREEENHRRLLGLLSRYDFVKLVGIPVEERLAQANGSERCTGVVSCLFDGYSAEEMGNVLDEQGIAVRAGLQCAPLAHRTLGTFPAGTVRFSTQYFTDDADFAALEAAMEYIKQNR